LTGCSAGESRKAIFEELGNAVQSRYHSQVAIEGMTQKGESVFIKRRITTALRWYTIQEKLGWATVVLGDVMPAHWFEYARFSDAKWENLLKELAPYGDILAGEAMHLLEKAIGGDAPIRLLQKSPLRDFGNWLDAFISKQKRCRGSLKSVAWIAGRIAQRWCADPTFPVPYLFEKLRLTPASAHWPNAGEIATSTLEPFAWDVLPHGLDPLCVSPLDQLILALIPGLQFDTIVQGYCGGCKREIVLHPTVHLTVLAETAAEAQSALDRLLVIFQSN